jgi:ABC-type multidrug transport system permease subunit
MLAVFRKDLHLLLRDRTALVLSLIAPLALITIITFARQRSAEPPRPIVPVVDDDKGPVAAAFVELLGKHADVVRTDGAGAARMVRELNRAPAALVFPRGLSKRYLQGRPSEITLLTDPAQAVGLDAVRALLLVMDRDAAELADPLHEELLVYHEQNLTGTRLSPKAVEQNVPGFTIMFVLLAVVLGSASMMHDERAYGTLARLLIAPSGFAPLLTGKLGVRCALGFAQMVVLLLWGRWMFGLSLGSSPLALAAVAAALAFAAAALGLLVAAVAATREQTLPISLATTLGLAAVGGLWWPISLVPQWLRVFGQLFFPTWAMYGLSDLILRDRGFDAVLAPVAVMAAQGALLLAAALWLFRRRTRGSA